MRTLFLLRHAKSDWADPALPDHARPLARRGAEAAARIAVYMQATGVEPGLVLCSSARRAVDTLDVLRSALGDDVSVNVSDELYGADAGDLLGRLCTVDGAIRSVMVVGHNPGLQDLATELAGDGEPTAISQLHTKFPTAALATLDLGAAGWSDLAPGQAYLSSLVLPRRLPAV